MTQQTFTVDYGLSIIDNSPGGGSLTGVDGAVVVTASDLANTAAWTFEPTGNLTLPSNTASINYANGTPYGGGGGANTGNIAFSGTAIEIAPGASETNINISPTSEGWAFVQLPNNATANTANTRVVNAAGNVTIETGDFSTGGSNVSTWTFNNTGVLTLPGEGVVRTNNDTVVIQSYDTANAAGYGMYVGTAGGLYFQQASNPVWLSIAPNASNVEIAAGVATGGAAGHSISISAGAADQTNYFTTAGGNINITGGLGAFNDGGGGGPGGSVNISAGNSSDPAGVPGNVNIDTGPNTWTFDYNGTLNLPEGTAYIGSAANTLTLHANDSEAIYISAISGGISAETNGNITLISNVDGTTNYAWTFDNTGNLAAPGIITANTFVSNSYNVVTAGNLFITSQYGLGTTGTILEDNGDLEVYGSGGGGAIVGWTNNYSTLGNVATVNFNTVDSPGNILVRTGNRAATEYNWIFANNGTMSFPSNAINTGANPATVWSNDSSKLLWRDAAGGAPGQPVQTTITAGNGTATITVSTGVLAVQSLKTWTFNTAGNVVFPDTTVQTTAYPGTANTLSLIGNITGGNVLTGGLISATGNITGGNLRTAGLITATGNITGGNVLTNGLISAAGNITGGNSTVTGNAVITYTPATTAGYGITVNAANTQGGTGYADFLRATNTSGGATNPNKSFRLSSTGGLEIINSAYSATLLALSDSGNVSIAGQYQVSGKQAVNGPAFSAYAAATLQTITSGSQQKVLFQTEEFDTNSNYASSRFTPTVEGYYQLNAEVRLDGATGTGECMIILYKNGSEYKRGWNSSGTQFASSFWAMTVSSVAYANGTTDYFEIYVQQGSGGTISVTAVNNPAITWFNGCMLRGA